jgi:hypothetical protein
MSFEEDFPSLKGKFVEPFDIVGYHPVDYKYVKEVEEGDLLKKDDIIKNCLDKQKVKEAIKKSKVWDSAWEKYVIDEQKLLLELNIQ